jgi:hypothetical protein
MAKAELPAKGWLPPSDVRLEVTVGYYWFPLHAVGFRTWVRLAMAREKGWDIPTPPFIRQPVSSIEKWAFFSKLSVRNSSGFRQLSVRQDFQVSIPFRINAGAKVQRRKAAEG